MNVYHLYVILDWTKQVDGFIHRCLLAMQISVSFLALFIQYMYISGHQYSTKLGQWNGLDELVLLNAEGCTCTCSCKAIRLHIMWSSYGER